VEAAAAANRKRRPTIAHYLGLNSEVGLLHIDSQIEKPASPPAKAPVSEPAPPKVHRKRTRKTRDEGNTQKQRRVSDRLHVKQPTSRDHLKSKGIQRKAPISKDASPDPLNPSTAFSIVSVPDAVSLPQAHAPLSDSQLSFHSAPEFCTQQPVRISSQVSPNKTSAIVSKRKKRSDPLPAECSSSEATVWATSSLYSPQDAAEFFDDDIDEIFESIDIVDSTNNDLPTDDQVRPRSSGKSIVVQSEDNGFDDGFDDGLDDDDFLMLTTETTNNHTDANDSPRGLGLLSDLSSSLNKPAADANRFDTAHATNSPVLSHQLVSSVTGHIQHYAHDIDRNEQRKPIVRPVFPDPVRDRSPIVGLTPNTLLRTCFRIGEAINTGRGAIKEGKNVILELYARVLYSKRYNNKQRFVFCDLYHTNAPYINAVYDAAIWDAGSQFNYDSARLLQEMKMCRCIGKMKKEGGEWVLVMSSVWEASWEDIAWVEGIVNC
jgi:hypothetical protein